MKAGRIVYIAGSYSADPEAGTLDALRVAEVLLETSPEDAPIIPVIPHTMIPPLQALMGTDRLPEDSILAMCLELVRWSHGLIRIPGTYSRGSDLEVGQALLAELPVWTWSTELEDHLRSGGDLETAPTAFTSDLKEQPQERNEQDEQGKEHDRDPEALPASETEEGPKEWR